MIDGTIKGVIIAIFGTAFGWSLNQLTAWFRIKHEDKRNLKNVLYHLLETYKVLYSYFEFNNLTKKITEKVLLKMPEEERSLEGDARLKMTLSKFAKTFIKQDLLKNVKKLESSYQKAIHSLATIDPLRAYYLSSKLNLRESFEGIENYLESFIANLNTNEIKPDLGIEGLMNILKPGILRQEIQDMESEIIDISWDINPVTWWKAKRYFHRLRKRMTEEFDKKLDDIFMQLEPLLKD